MLAKRAQQASEAEKLRGQLQRLKAQMVTAAAERDEESQQQAAAAERHAADAQAAQARLQSQVADLQRQLEQRDAEAAAQRQQVRRWVCKRRAHHMCHTALRESCML